MCDDESGLVQVRFPVFEVLDYYRLQNWPEPEGEPLTEEQALYLFEHGFEEFEKQQKAMGFNPRPGACRQRLIDENNQRIMKKNRSR